VSEARQNKIQASYVRKYLKTRMILTTFESGSLTLGHGKLEKVVEFEKLIRVQTLLYDIALFH